MGFHELLSAECISLPLEARDKWEAIRMLARRLVEAGAVPEERFEEVHRALTARERELSTGMERGIAIPHAAVELPGPPRAVVGIAPQGIPFESLDGEPARIVVLLITRRDLKLEHLRTLSLIVRILSDPQLRQELVAAQEPGRVLELFRSREERVLAEGGAWSGRRQPSA